MNLDPRIIEGKRPLTCFDLEEAEEYVGKKCYISNEYDFFRNLDFTQQKILNDIEDCETPFHYDDNDFDKQAEFCLPCDWVKDPEKKYRPYSLNEFLERFKIGSTVTFRIKKGEHVPEEECRVEYTRLITGYETLPENRDIPGKGSILLGGCPPIGLARLFEFYELENEYYVPTVWQPFGIEVKEEECETETL